MSRNKDKFLDTNTLARYILDDVAEQADVVEKLLKSAQISSVNLFIVPEVLIELRYVLGSLYNFPKEAIARSLKDILSIDSLEVLATKSVSMVEVCNLYETHNLSIEDCLYLEICKQHNLELITFDKKLKKVAEAYLL